MSRTKQKNLPKYLWRKSAETLRHEGAGALIKKTATYLTRSIPAAHLVLYKERISKKESLSQADSWYRRKGKKVSIIIPSYNDYHLLRKCLASLEKTTDRRRVEIVIVDDYCTAKSREELKKFIKKNISVVFRKKNGGFAQAVNTGIRRRSKGSDVVLLNSDIIAKPFWLPALQRTAYLNPSIAVVGPKLLYPNGRIQSAGTLRNKKNKLWFEHYFRFKPSSYPPANIRRPVIAITAACVYIKDSALKRIGLFDPKYTMGFEDTDYCLRVWLNGFEVYYEPLSTLIHLESATRGHGIGPRELKALKYFWNKWKSFLDGKASTESRILSEALEFIEQSVPGK